MRADALARSPCFFERPDDCLRAGGQLIPAPSTRSTSSCRTRTLRAPGFTSTGRSDCGRPRVRAERLVKGVEPADSWATDAHKWLNVPYDTAIAFVAHPAAHRARDEPHGGLSPRGGGGERKALMGPRVVATRPRRTHLRDAARARARRRGRAGRPAVRVRGALRASGSPSAGFEVLARRSSTRSSFACGERRVDRRPRSPPCRPRARATRARPRGAGAAASGSRCATGRPRSRTSTARSTRLSPRAVSRRITRSRAARSSAPRCARSARRRAQPAQVSTNSADDRVAGDAEVELTSADAPQAQRAAARADRCSATATDRPVIVRL